MKRLAVVRALTVALTGLVIAACTDVLSSPSVPASIEFVRLPAPAIVIGDSLRDITGAAVPVAAVVRNQQGDTLSDAPIRYTYADAERDTALAVDSVTGFVRALKNLKTTGTTARIAARVGRNLQVIRTLLVTTRPDSLDRGSASTAVTLRDTIKDTLKVVTTDTGTLATSNVSAELSVVVRHKEENSTFTQVPNWLVKFVLTYPANPTNDSTKAVFLVNDQRVLSNIDTTNGSGIASRFVRVRGSQFPTGNQPDSAVIEVSVNYRGTQVKGSPRTIVVPIIKKP